MIEEDSGVFYSRKVVMCGYKTGSHQPPIQGCKNCESFKRACHDHLKWDKCKHPAIFYYTVRGLVGSVCEYHREFVNDFLEDEEKYEEISREEFIAGSLIQG